MEEGRRILNNQSFFLSNERIEHKRKAYNILQVIATLGGLSAGLFGLIKSISTPITHSIVISKFIKLFHSDHNAKIYMLKSNQNIP